MAVVPMTKVQIILHKKEQQEALNLLQEAGVLEIKGFEEHPVSQASDEKFHQLEYEVSRLDYAIKFLNDYAEVKSGGLKAMLEGDALRVSPKELKETVDQFCYKDIIAQVESIDAEIVTAKNRYRELSEQIAILEPWKNLNFSPKKASETVFTMLKIGQIDKRDWELFQNDLIKKTPYLEVSRVSEQDTSIYVLILFLKEVSTEVEEVLQDYKFIETELSIGELTPIEELAELRNKITVEKDKLDKYSAELKKLAGYNDKLKIVYDYIIWQRDQSIVSKSFGETKQTINLTGWLPKEHFDLVSEKLMEKVPASVMYEIPIAEDELSPVAIKNNTLIKPFEVVTCLYGLPLYNEIDPTPYLSAFFIVFFGMCLSDAGYGLTLFLTTFFLLKFFNIEEGVRRMLKLIMYGGIFTFIFGIMYGGWFGIEARYAVDIFPIAFFNPTSGLYIGQIFEPIKNPLMILLLSMVLGIVQVIVGLSIDLYWKAKNGRLMEGLLDSGTWIYFLVVLIAYSLSIASILPSSLTPIFLYAVYAGLALLVLTQGRAQSSIIGKIGIELLSLYNLVGYFSDVLSYARLLALGLATGIIALSVNIIAIDVAYGMIPYVGILVAIPVLIGGHIFNLALSALGSFIHSARLQFVEFFGKFMEGGGSPFRPLHKVCRYIKVINN